MQLASISSSSIMAGPAGVEPATPDLEGEPFNSIELNSGALDKFRDFCRVDRQLAERTVIDYCVYLRQFNRFLEATNKTLVQATVEDIRSFLSKFQDKSTSTRANILKSLRNFYGRFLQRPHLVQSFAFPRQSFSLKTVPEKEDLRRFFGVLTNDRDRAVFLLYASSGVRRSELLSLTLDDLDLENRTIIPRHAHQNASTKNSWVSFFNKEADAYLRQYLENRQSNDKRLFRSACTVKRSFDKANKKTQTRIRITPQVLRFWFANEMSRLGMSDRIIDAIQGRTPRTILARHYSDFSVERLKEAYDKTNLRVLD